MSIRTILTLRRTDSLHGQRGTPNFDSRLCLLAAPSELTLGGGLVGKRGGVLSQGPRENVGGRRVSTQVFQIQDLGVDLRSIYITECTSI